MRENKRLQCEGFSSKLKYDFEIPNGENVHDWVSNVVFKYHKDPTVNEFEIIVFLRQVLWAARKKKGFGEEEGENENEGKKRHHQSKTDLTSLFIPRVHTTYYYSIYLFLIFYKKMNFILFSIKQINKIPFLFSLKPLF